jgi:hypothetical protein
MEVDWSRQCRVENRNGGKSQKKKNVKCIAKAAGETLPPFFVSCHI